MLPTRARDMHTPSSEDGRSQLRRYVDCEYSGSDETCRALGGGLTEAALCAGEAASAASCSLRLDNSAAGMGWAAAAGRTGLHRLYGMPHPTLGRIDFPFLLLCCGLPSYLPVANSRRRSLTGRCYLGHLQTTHRCCLHAGPYVRHIDNTSTTESGMPEPSRLLATAGVRKTRCAVVPEVGMGVIAEGWLRRRPPPPQAPFCSPRHGPTMS